MVTLKQTRKRLKIANIRLKQARRRSKLATIGLTKSKKRAFRVARKNVSLIGSSKIPKREKRRRANLVRKILSV